MLRSLQGYCNGTAGTAAVEWSSQGVQKPLAGRSKTFPGHLLGCSEGRWEGAETSRSKNETHVVFGGLHWWWGIGVTAPQAVGGRPWQCGLPGSVASSLQGLRQMVEKTSSLVLTLMVKERWPRRSTA
jgi:hypothetical protein